MPFARQDFTAGGISRYLALGIGPWRADRRVSIDAAEAKQGVVV